MRLIIVGILVMMMLACSTEPQPLVYGKDGCHACKMTLMDKKFGAEVVTTKGKVYKFDDVNCMLNFLHSGELGERDIAHRLVIDFANPEKLIDTSHAFFLKSNTIKSPMASQVAAFEREEDMKRVKEELGGIYLVWGELVTQFK
jgi:copper chaperone NosL